MREMPNCEMGTKNRKCRSGDRPSQSSKLRFLQQKHHQNYLQNTDRFPCKQKQRYQKTLKQLCLGTIEAVTTLGYRPADWTERTKIKLKSSLVLQKNNQKTRTTSQQKHQNTFSWFRPFCENKLFQINKLYQSFSDPGSIREHKLKIFSSKPSGEDFRQTKKRQAKLQLRYASGFNMQADIVRTFQVYNPNTQGMYCKNQFKLFDVGSHNF